MSGSCEFESLESRRLLSGFTVDVVNVDGGTFESSAPVTSRGTLVIKGDDGPNAIAVVRDNNLIKYTVRRGVGEPATPEGTAFTVVIHASKVKRVLVEAGGGDDRVFIDDELAKRATVYGGGGSDNLEGNHGATLVGGGGNDRLSVPPFDIAGWVKNGFLVDYVGVYPPPALLLGGDGNDVLVASAQDSVIGGRGDDTAVEIYDIAPKAIEQLDAEADFGPQQASGIETFDVLVLKQVFGM